MWGGGSLTFVQGAADPPGAWLRADCAETEAYDQPNALRAGVSHETILMPRIYAQPRGG